MINRDIWTKILLQSQPACVFYMSTVSKWFRGVCLEPPLLERWLMYINDTPRGLRYFSAKVGLFPTKKLYMDADELMRYHRCVLLYQQWILLQISYLRLEKVIAAAKKYKDRVERHGGCREKLKDLVADHARIVGKCNLLRLEMCTIDDIIKKI